MLRVFFDETLVKKSCRIYNTSTLCNTYSNQKFVLIEFLRFIPTTIAIRTCTTKYDDDAATKET